MKVNNLSNRRTKLKKRQIHFKTDLNLPKYGKIEGFEVDEVLFSLLDGLVDSNERVKDTIVKTLMKFANYQPDFILKSILTFLQVQKTSVNHQYSLLSVVKKCVLELKNIPNGIIKEILLFMLKELSFLKASDPRHVEMREIVNIATVLCPSFSVDVILTLIKDIEQSEEYFEILCIYVRILTHLCTTVPKNSYVKSILISSHVMNLYNKEVFREQNGEICKEMSSLLYAISNMLLITTYVNAYYGAVMPLYSIYSTSALLSSSRSGEEYFREQESHSELYESLDLDNNTYREFEESYRNLTSNNNSSSNDKTNSRENRDDLYHDIILLPATTRNNDYSNNIKNKSKKMVRPNIENIKNILEPLYGLMLDYYIPKIYINPSYNNTCLELLYSLVVMSEYISVECFKNNSMNLLTCIIVRFLNYVPNLQLNDNLWFKLYKINSNNLTNKFVSLFSNPNVLDEMPPKFYIGGLRIYLQILNNYDRYAIYTNSYNLCNILFSLLVILYNNNNKYLILYLKNFVSSPNGSFVDDSSRLLSNGNFTKNGMNTDNRSNDREREDECDGFYVDNIVGCLRIMFGVESSGLMLMEFLYEKISSGVKDDLIVSLYVYIILLNSNKYTCSDCSSSATDGSSVLVYHDSSFGVKDSGFGSGSYEREYNILLYKVIDNVNNIFNQNVNDNYSLYILVQFINMLFVNKCIAFYTSYKSVRLSSLASLGSVDLENPEDHKDDSTNGNGNDSNTYVDKDNKDKSNSSKDDRKDNSDVVDYKELVKKRNKKVYYLMNYVFEYKINIDINNRVNRNLKLYNSSGKNNLDVEFFNTLYQNSSNNDRTNRSETIFNKIFVKSELVDDEEVMFEECVDNIIKNSGEQFLHYLVSKLMNNVRRNSLSVLRYMYKLFRLYNVDMVKKVLDEDGLVNLLVLVMIYVHDPVYHFGEAYYSSKLLFMLYSMAFSKGNLDYVDCDKHSVDKNNSYTTNNRASNSSSTGNASTTTKDKYKNEEEKEEKLMKDSGVMLSNLVNYSRLDSFYIDSNNSTDRNKMNEEKESNKEKKIKNKNKKRNDREITFLNTNDIVANFTNVSRLVKYLNALYLVDGSKVVKSISLLVKKLKNRPLLTRSTSFSFTTPSFLNTSSNLFGNSSSFFGSSGTIIPLKINDIVIDTDLTSFQNLGILNIICIFMNHSNVGNVINSILSTTSSSNNNNLFGFKEEVAVDLVSDKGGDLVVKEGEEEFLFWNNNSDFKYILLSLSSICISNLSSEINYKNLVLKLDYLMIMNPLKDTAFSLFGKTSSYLQSERIRLMIISALTHIYVQSGRYFYRKESGRSDNINKNSNSSSIGKTSTTTRNNEDKGNEKKKEVKMEIEEVMKVMNERYNEIVNKMNLKRDKMLLAERDGSSVDKVEQNEWENTREEKDKEKGFVEEKKKNKDTDKDNKQKRNKKNESKTQDIEDEEDILIRYIMGPLINMFNNESDTSVQEYLLGNLLLIVVNSARLSSLGSLGSVDHENLEDHKDDVELISVIFNKLIGIMMKLINESSKMNDKNIRERFENNEILNLTKVERDVSEKDQTLPFYCFMLLSSFSPHFKMFKNTDYPYLVLYYILYYSDYYTFVKVSKHDLLYQLNYNDHRILKVSKCVHYYLTNLYRNLVTFSHSDCSRHTLDSQSSESVDNSQHTVGDWKMNKVDWSVLYKIVVTVLSDNNNVENLLVRNRLYILVQFLDSVLNENESNKSKVENDKDDRNSKNKNATHELDRTDSNNTEMSTNQNENDEDNWVRIVILVWSYILKMSDNSIKLLLINALYKLLDYNEGYDNNSYNYNYGRDGEFGQCRSEQMEWENESTNDSCNSRNDNGDSNSSSTDKTSTRKDMAVKLDKISKLNSVDNINKLIPERLIVKFMVFSMNYLESSSYISNSLVKILHRILQNSMNKIPVSQLQSSLVVIFKRFQQYFQNNNLPLFLRSFLVDVFKYDIDILFNILFNYNIKFQSTVVFIIIKNDYLLHLLIKYLHRYIESQLNQCFSHSQSNSQFQSLTDLVSRSDSLDSRDSECSQQTQSSENLESVVDGTRVALSSDNNQQSMTDRLYSGSTNVLYRESKEVVLDYLLEYNMNVFNNNNKLIDCYSDYVNLLIIYINVISYFDNVSLMGDGFRVKDTGFGDRERDKDVVEKRGSKMVKLLQMMNCDSFVYQNSTDSGREGKDKNQSNETKVGEVVNKEKKIKNKKKRNNKELMLYYSVNIIGRNRQVLKSFLNYTYSVVSSLEFSNYKMDDMTNTSTTSRSNEEEKEVMMNGVLVRMLVDLVRYKLLVGYDAKILKIMNVINRDEKKMNYELVYYYLKNMYNSKLNPYYNIYGVKYVVIENKRKKFLKELIGFLVSSMDNEVCIGYLYYYMKVISMVLEIVSKNKNNNKCINNSSKRNKDKQKDNERNKDYKRYGNELDKIISLVVRNKTFFVNKKLRYSYLVMYCSIIKYLKIKYGNLEKLENLKGYLFFPTCVSILSKDSKSLVKVSRRYLELFVLLFFGNCFGVENVNLCEEILTGLMMKGNTTNKCLCNCNNTTYSTSNRDSNASSTGKTSTTSNDHSADTMTLTNVNNSDKSYTKNLCLSYTFQLLYFLSYFLPVSNYNINEYNNEKGGNDSSTGKTSTTTKDNKEKMNEERINIPNNIIEEFKTIKKSQLDQKSSKVLFRNSIIGDSDDEDENEEFIDINHFYKLKLNLSGTSSCAISRSSSYSILNKEPILRPSFSIGNSTRNGINSNNDNNNKSFELENMSSSPDLLLMLVLCDYSVKEGSPKSNFKYSSDSLEEYLLTNRNVKNLNLLRLKSISSISNSFLFLSSNIYRFITMQKYLEKNLIQVNIFSYATNTTSSNRDNRGDSNSSSTNKTSTTTKDNTNTNSYSTASNFSFNNNLNSFVSSFYYNNITDKSDAETETIEDLVVLNSIKLSIFIMTKSSLYISNSNSNGILKSHSPTNDHKSPREFMYKKDDWNDRSGRIIRKNHQAHFESLCNVVIIKLCKLIENNKFKLYTYKQLQHLSNIIPH